MIRVTSTLWVSAYIRRCNIEGAVATMIRRGSAEAGAIFVIIDRLDGSADLYGPAPQSESREDGEGDRLFERLLERASPPDVKAKTDREFAFDPDIWIVEVEDRSGGSRLDVI